MAIVSWPYILWRHFNLCVVGLDVAATHSSWLDSSSSWVPTCISRTVPVAEPVRATQRRMKKTIFWQPNETPHIQNTTAVSFSYYNATKTLPFTQKISSSLPMDTGIPTDGCFVMLPQSPSRTNRSTSVTDYSRSFIVGVSTNGRILVICWYQLHPTTCFTEHCGVAFPWWRPVGRSRLLDWSLRGYLCLVAI